MKYAKQFLIILGFTFAGEALHAFLPLPVPASIYGIVLLLAALCSGRMPLAAVDDTATFLVQIMPMMFIPPAAGLIDSWGMIKGSLVQYALVVVVSTLGVMAVSGWVTQALNKKQKGAHHD